MKKFAARSKAKSMTAAVPRSQLTLLLQTKIYN